MTKRRMLLVGATMVMAAGADAQMRPPAFFGGVPGLAQFQAVQMQRHQARTLLYREALEELRKNPAAADVPDCVPGQKPTPEALCLARPVAAAAPEAGAPAARVEPAAKLPAKAEPVAPEVAAAKAAAAKPAAAAPAAVAHRRLAVLFGNNDYKKPIPELETPVADVSKTAEILKSRFGFEARVLKNAGKADIIEALNKLAAEATPEDSVLLFYAGHGYLMDDTKMGFWIPVDASVKTAGGWISNTDISKLLASIRARQLILVSDSCFSGSLTKEQKITAGSKPQKDEVLRRRSVLVLSSGGEEPVSDEGKEGHSIFAWNLIKTLETANGVTPGFEVYRSVHGQVTRDYPQEPQYGAVVSAGHAAGGEFLFDTEKP